MFRLDSLALVSLASYGLLAAVTVAAAPRRDLRRPLPLGTVVAGTALAYAAESPWIFLLGWILSLLPVWLDREGCGPAARWILAFSAASLALGTLFSGQPALGFAFLAAAALMRKGVFPFHFWITGAFERGPLPLLGLVLNSHLGAYAIIRFGLPVFSGPAAQALPLAGALAIFTSLFTALTALVARQPRRILALLCASQAGFILAGLENRNVEGITGALVHWWVVAFATTGLLSIYRAIEVRTSAAQAPGGFLGLAYHAPRLAALFAVSALALVGLPGTLGFAAEDLLFHGSLESHPLLGIGLPLATALNAVTSFRLFATLFLGRRGIHVPPVPDARPRERWALTIPAALLIATGIVPSIAVELRTPAAEWIAGMLAGR